jgi:hypothetical protein
MKKLAMAICMAAGTLILVSPAFSKGASHPGQGQAVVTVLPKLGKEAPLNITLQDVQIKVDRKETTVTNWVPLRGPNDSLQLVVLIDGSARSSLGQQLGDVASFILSLPATAKVAVAYMENGHAALAGPLSSDHALVARGLHMTGGSPGSTGSPYFCISDLARNWPSGDREARHEVVLITDGVDTFNPRFDPEDPYVQTAISDSVRAGLVVYSIYWRDRGNANNSLAEGDTGQSLLSEVTQATGGNSYWQGNGDPVSFQPYFEDLSWRLQNQYRLSFDTDLKGKPEIESLALKVGGPAAKVYAPQQVFIGAGVAAE